MLKGLQDIYTDYLLMSFLKTTATGLSELTENEISHDKITRMLNGKELTTKDLWMLTKKIIRKHETEEGIIIIDDTTEEKQYTTENDIVCWHYDHAKRENVKGIKTGTMASSYNIVVLYKKDGKEYLITCLAS